MGGTIDRITGIFVKELNLGENDKAIVKYSLTVYSTTVFGYLAIVLAAWPLGVVKLSLAAAVTGSLLRIFSGGAHASCSKNCILSGAVIFPVFGLTAKHAPGSVDIFYVIVGVVVLFVFWSVYSFAPADTPGKPITTKGQRNKLRRYSFGISVLWVVWVLCGYFEVIRITNEFLLASVLGFHWQGFSLTPAGYRFIAFVDTLVSYLTKGGK